jgi:hypothetical protein
VGSRDKALAIVRVRMSALFAPGLDTLVDVAIDDVVDQLLAIGRAQGLREAAGICDVLASDIRTVNVAGATAAESCSAEITAAAEKAERGDG